MKKLGKLLLVLALIAAVMSSATLPVFADNHEDDPVPAPEYYTSGPELVHKRINPFVDGSSVISPSNDDSSVGFPEEFEYHYIESDDRDVSMFGECWVKWGTTEVSYESMHGNYYISFKVAIDIYRQFIDGEATDQYAVFNVDTENGHFDYIFTEELEDVSRVMLCWWVINPVQNPYLPTGFYVHFTLDLDCNHIHEWLFDGFEWDTSDGVTASAVYHCADENCAEQCTIPATIKRVKSQPTWWEASVTAAQSPDGMAHTEMKAIYHSHRWIFEGFQWDTVNGVTANAVYRCTDENCAEQCTIPAVITYMNGMYQATVTAAQSPDGMAHTEMKTFEHSHQWVFDCFEWNTTDGVKAYAVYHCADTFCSAQYKVEATVTKVTGIVVPIYIAKVTAEQSPDGMEHTAKKTVLPPVLPFPHPNPSPVPIIGPIVRKDINPILVPVLPVNP